MTMACASSCAPSLAGGQCRHRSSCAASGRAAQQLAESSARCERGGRQHDRDERRRSGSGCRASRDSACACRPACASTKFSSPTGIMPSVVNAAVRGRRCGTARRRCNVASALSRERKGGDASTSGPVLDDEAHVDQHADRDEEQRREQIAHRHDLGNHAMIELALRQQQAGEERTECRRQAEQRADARGAERQHRRRDDEQLRGAQRATRDP